MEKPSSLYLVWDIILWSSSTFLAQNVVTKLKSKNYVFGKNLRNWRTLRYQKNICNYGIIVNKLPMWKQGLKTINAEFVSTRALSHLLLFGSDLRQSRSQVWILHLCSRPPLMQQSKVLFRMWIIYKFWCHKFIQKKYDRKRRLPRTHV